MTSENTLATLLKAFFNFFLPTHAHTYTHRHEGIALPLLRMRVQGNDDDILRTLGGEWYHQGEILITVAHMQNQKSALNKGDLLSNTRHCMNHIGRAVASCHQRENSEIP